MTETIYQTLMHTPWWVYIIFIVLVKLGLRASKTSITHLPKLAIAPAIFTYMAVDSLINNLHLTRQVLLIFSGTGLLGILIGYLQVTRLTLSFDREKYLIKVPGTWSVIVIMMIIFSTKYCLGYELALDPNILENSRFEIFFITVNAVCSGIFIGKFICYIKRLYTEPSVELQINCKDLSES